MKKNLSLFFAAATLSLVTACGGTGIQSQANNAQTPPPADACVTTPQSFQNAQIFPEQFNLGSDYPADLEFTPEGNALAVLTFNPVSVIFLDPANPSQLHPNYPVFDASAIPEAAFPSQMIFDPDPSRSDRAYFLSATHLIGFNPNTGDHLFSQELTTPIPLGSDLFYSSPCDCNDDGLVEEFVSGSFTPSYPAALAIVENQLLITLSNLYLDDSYESYYLPGLVLAFDLLAEAPYVQAAATPHVFLPGYNATGISVLPQSNEVLVTLSGDATFAPVTYAYTPQTNSLLVELNPNDLSIGDSLNLGFLAANYKELAIRADESVAYLGSAAFPQVMEIALNPLQVNGILNLSAEPSGFITDQKLLPGGAGGSQVLAVASFDDSSIYGVDLTQAQLGVLSALDFSFAANPGVTGVGPLAVSPNVQNGEDCIYDFYTLTSSPGTVGAAITH